MTVVDLARRRAELERMSARRPSSPRPASGPVDMRHARRMAELATRPRVYEGPFWADRHASDPA